MTLHENDPRLTAYALGELDAAERNQVEAYLRESEAARQSVEQIRAVANMLTNELANEPYPVMSDNRREAVEHRAAGSHEAIGTATAGPLHEVSRVRERAHFKRQSDRTSMGLLVRRYWIPTCLAASLLLVATGWYMTLPKLSRARELSHRIVDARVRKDGPQPAQVGGDKLQKATADETLETRARVPFEQSNLGARRKREAVVAPGGGIVTYDDALAAISNEHDRNLADGPVASSLGGRSDDVTGLAALAITRPEWITSKQLLQTLSRETVRFPIEGHESERLYRFPFHDGLRLGQSSTEAYQHIVENPFLFVEEKPLSTFSIDVDTASYANVRRMLNMGQLPPPDAVRIEELVNYFDYDYPQPTDDHPFSVVVEVSECPWNTDHRLARVGIKGVEYEADERPTANLVFLIDVSGSMQPPNRLPLLKDALRMMVGELRPDDTVAIVVYAGASGLVLPATSCRNKQTVLSALDNLQPGGSTNGASGIQLAYDTATENFIEGGINRVILATDGDFNVGVTNRNELTSLIEEKAKTGVFLSVLGVGMGNLKDATLEQLADKGNGNYAYIDTISEAQKVLVDQLHGTLVTIAKDVKIQVEFNPAEVAAYRLIGYENRMLAARDFNDDAKDAGEIGAGHTVTAFYEIVPAGDEVDASDETLNPPDDHEATEARRHEGTKGDLGFEISTAEMSDPNIGADTDADPDTDAGEIDPLRYTSDSGMTAAARSGELMTVKLRYKQPDEDISTRMDIPVVDIGSTFESTSDDFAFAAAVVSFGMLLRGSARGGEFTLEDVAEMAKNSLGEDAFDYRAEFVTLVERARALSVAPASNR